MDVDLLSSMSNPWFMRMAMQYFTLFLMVMVRISGLMLIGPFFGHSAIPPRIRILLTVALAIMLTPAMPHLRARGFAKLDRDQNRQLIGEEIPRGIKESDQIQLRSTPQGDDVVSVSEFQAMAKTPSTIFDLLWIAGTELMLGMMLGLGMMIILSGLQLAGEMFDQQAGTALSEIFNPALGTPSSPSGQVLFLLGSTVILTMPPFDGHLLILSSLIQTFEVLPVGLAIMDVSTIQLIRDLITQSLVLGIQVSAPLLATMALISISLGFLGYTVPQVNVLVIGFPIRAMMSLLILTVTLSGAAETVTNLVPQVIDSITASLLAAGQ